MGHALVELKALRGQRQCQYRVHRCKNSCCDKTAFNLQYHKLQPLNHVTLEFSRNFSDLRPLPLSERECGEVSSAPGAPPNRASVVEAIEEEANLDQNQATREAAARSACGAVVTAASEAATSASSTERALFEWPAHSADTISASAAGSVHSAGTSVPYTMRDARRSVSVMELMLW